MESARDARGDSYCPDSKEKVGAALLTVDGETITGCSVENRRPSLKTCALQVAFIKVRFLLILLLLGKMCMKGATLSSTPRSSR
jgi:hypothetical protein